MRCPRWHARSAPAGSWRRRSARGRRAVRKWRGPRHAVTASPARRPQTRPRQAEQGAPDLGLTAGLRAALSARSNSGRACLKSDARRKVSALSRSRAISGCGAGRRSPGPERSASWRTAGAAVMISGAPPVRSRAARPPHTQRPHDGPGRGTAPQTRHARSGRPERCRATARNHATSSANVALCRPAAASSGATAPASLPASIRLTPW